MPVPTLLSESDRSTILTRIRQVRPDTPRKWGQMDAARMLCHITDQMRVAVGELVSTPRSTFLSRSFLKWLVVNTGFQAPPGKVQTAPEMLTTSPKSWDADLAVCEALVSRVGAGEAKAEHPTFGRLNPEEWGRLSWKHLDHHLRQFGV
jgi:site-specific recombinase XerC